MNDTTSPFSLSDAIGIVEGYFAKNPNYELAKTYFEETLKNASQYDYEKKGDCYYYLLRLLFKGHIPFEHPIARTYYDRMTEHFMLQEARYKADINREEDMRKRSVKNSQLKAFYKLMERYYSSLESLYAQHDFVEARDRAYFQKMLFRKSRFLLERQFSLYIGYALLQISSKYGLSIERWAMTALMSIFIFSLLFYIVDIPSAVKMVPAADGYTFDYFYASASNFTMLGFADVAPHTALQKFLSLVEVMMGYAMLGTLVSIITKRL